MSIRALIDSGLEGDDLVRAVMDETGEGEFQARFMIAFVEGRTDGDVIQLDENGERVPRKRVSPAEIFEGDADFDVLRRRGPEVFREAWRRAFPETS